MLISNVNPFFGDHVLVEFIINIKTCKAVPNICRDWRKYSKDVLNKKMSGVNWEIKIDNVQQYWNVFESMLIILLVGIGHFSTKKNYQVQDFFLCPLDF